MIFIIGGQGFVGSALARYCQRRGIPYQVITRSNYKAFIGQRCDLLINANGNSNKRLARREPLTDFDKTVASVRRSLHDFQFERYVYLSSCDVYADCRSPHTTSETQAIPMGAQSTYGFHKYLAEQCVQHEAPNYLIFRCGGFIGPGLWKNPIYDILQGQRLWVDPDSELQYMHTDMAAEIIFDVIQREHSNHIYNLCGLGTIRLKTIIDAVSSSVRPVPNAPCVHYEVATAKLATQVTVPSTVEMVMAFIHADPLVMNDA